MYPISPAAYDRTITVFSPDGRLFQVEYAREAVKRGTTAAGLIYEGGVMLAVDKNITSRLIVPESIEKIFKIDEHIGIATSGLVADARRLVEDARLIAQRNRLVYNQPITVFDLTRQLCNIKQIYTQYGGTRPFGVALLVAGVDNGPKLFETDPSGAFTQASATAIGMGKNEVVKLFEENYEPRMLKDAALKLVLRGLNIATEERLRKEHVEVICIEAEVGFTKLDQGVISNTFDELKGEFKRDRERRAE